MKTDKIKTQAFPWKILSKVKVWPDNGPKFGRGGDGFQRLNLACPIETLKQALRGLAKALADSTLS